MNGTNYIPADLEKMLDRAEAELREQQARGQSTAVTKKTADIQNPVTKGTKPADKVRKPETGSRKREKTPDSGQPSAAPQYPINDIDFQTRFRGYDRRQVADYINALTEDYNKICARCEELEKKNEQLRVGTDTIGTAMLKAEAMARQIIAQAEAQAKNIWRNTASPTMPPASPPSVPPFLSSSNSSPSARSPFPSGGGVA